MTWYDEWCQALLSPGSPAPAGLSTWNGSDPAQRFAVYRNNVLVVLRDALADTFPALRDHLGHSTFADLALDYVCQYPPHSPILADYGHSFPDWLVKQQVLRQLPSWCHELARLERAYVDSFHAADAETPTLVDWQHLLADEQRLVHSRPQLHPSLHLIEVQHVILPLWAASQEAARLSHPLDLEDERPTPRLRFHTLCVLREEEEVAVVVLSQDAALALKRIASGSSLAEALADIDDEPLRIQLLAHWIRLPLFCAL